ncbi:efflux transporter periplasmic adaptor subunit [Salinivibrio sp. AR647]|uniref:efflux RND transporter periplasmic adaptor subunit n=1 Tax=Salinivibrio sp. AR647 TaxID=1909438 RepID=UPI0009850464|nr:efflux RND transporter periplasmic adaptor subunit [Salinivibrio sp. AR647]OOE92046.1 efflux transporter periplasmic adaptor subunit [Salinivibrio sp. AR647]
MTKRLILMLVACALVFGGIFAYKMVGDHFMNQFFDNMPAPTATVTATTVSTHPWREQQTTIGSFAAINETQLTTEANGIVDDIFFDNATPVKKGQRLLTLDASVDQAELRRLESVAELAQLEMRRYQRLYRDKNVSESELKRKESEAKQANAAVDSQQARIAQKSLTAPFDGIIGIRKVSLGQLIAPGSVVATLTSVNPIHLNFTLPEQQLSTLQDGQTVSATITARPEQTFTGTVTAISPVVTQSSRSVDIQATFDNPDAILRSGMFARVSLDQGEETQNVLLAPQTAIQFNPYGNAVFVIQEQDDALTVQQRFVQTGARRGDMIVIEGGLESGDRIVTSGLLKLRNGSNVKISDNPRVQPSEDLDPNVVNQ